jgi:hypothetical protein
MSKYEKLWEYLQKEGAENIQLSFAEIKDILGIDIDHSFLTYKKEAKEYGYIVGKISLKKENIQFSKIE